MLMFDNKNFLAQILGTGPQLSVLLSPETAGTYSCQANTPGFSQISASTSVMLRAPPSIMTETKVSLLSHWLDLSQTLTVWSIFISRIFPRSC